MNTSRKKHRFMTKILLVSTAAPWSPATPGTRRTPLAAREATRGPVSLPVVAGVTPEDVEVDIWDEYTHGPIDETTQFEKKYDLIGFIGRESHLPRAKEVAQVFRRRGIPAAIGGVGVSVAPETCREAFDILFVGDAELTWPQFLADWRMGCYRKVYR